MEKQLRDMVTRWKDAADAYAYISRLAQPPTATSLCYAAQATELRARIEDVEHVLGLTQKGQPVENTHQMDTTAEVMKEVAEERHFLSEDEAHPGQYYYTRSQLIHDAAVAVARVERLDRGLDRRAS